MTSYNVINNAVKTLWLIHLFCSDALVSSLNLYSPSCRAGCHRQPLRKISPSEGKIKGAFKEIALYKK